MKTTKILVGIPVLDNIEMTRVCLRHMFANTQVDRLGLDVTFFVLDNGSSDDIAGLLRNEFLDGPFPIHYRRNPRNLGVAIAWNQILRFSPEPVPPPSFAYDYYVIANNDAFVGPDWLQPMVEAMTVDSRIGWISCLENGSPVAPELVEAHAITRQHRVDPSRPYTSEAISRSLAEIYGKWGGHEQFCAQIKAKELPLFLPFVKENRSAVCFMVRPAMVEELGFFDEDFWPVGVAEDLEYFLRIEGIIAPPTGAVQSASEKWLAGFCGRSVVHHNWCSTRQGKNFDGRRWDKLREKYWKKKFGRSKKYYTKLLP